MVKTCTKCGVPKPLTDFFAERRLADGRRRTCKVCDSARRRALRKSMAPEQRAAAKILRAQHKEYDRQYTRSYRKRYRAKALIRNARTRAEKKGLPFDLDLHVAAIQARLDAGRCELTGVPFNFEGGITFDSPSIDRVEPSRGYVIDNIRVVIHLMNSALGHWGEETLKTVMRAWLEKEVK